jgi:hypothetical protein
MAGGRNILNLRNSVAGGVCGAPTNPSQQRWCSQSSRAQHNLGWCNRNNKMSSCCRNLCRTARSALVPGLSTRRCAVVPSVFPLPRFSFSSLTYSRHQDAATDAFHPSTAADAALTRPQHGSDPTTIQSSVNYISSNSSAQSLTTGYQSPLQDMFLNMEQNGPTALGTTSFVPLNTKQLSCGVYEKDLRFTTTSYGRFSSPPYVHPNEHAVAMSVCLADLPLSSPTEFAILREIVGPSRLSGCGNGSSSRDGQGGFAKRKLTLQSNQFGSRVENKRHLVSMLDRIVLACQRLAATLPKETTSATV